jgi:GT2 family glycosyltransferase
MSVVEPRYETIPAPMMARPHVRGKFLYAGEEKLTVRGATYGAFRPDENGDEYHDLDVVERDLAQMAANGMTAVRIPHTTPPRSLLDIAQRHGLRVMVGLSVEQYIGFLIDKKDDAPNIEDLVRSKVRSCAGHPALLCYALGNEVPAPIVRWLGPRRVERFLARMHAIVKEEDPEGLVTYVNYPTTEYLRLPFLDLVCFNVYLESPETLRAYLARLQNVAGDRPLLMSEVGLDSLRNGELAQAKVLDWQVRTSLRAGCAGLFIFAWTDEWYRGDAVDDWLFGLTTHDRRPKPALAAVRRAMAAGLEPSDGVWPRMSVVVCTHNGARTIEECCEGLSRLEYPDFEVIVVDDGSTDGTAAIAGRYGFRLIRTGHEGLSRARNRGLSAATGEFVAYIDDDAYPDPQWLTYLAIQFASTDHAAVGGPNLTPSHDSAFAQCVGNSPGNPTHVLLSDEEAEHLPGCNMAFRKSALENIGGFDGRFRTAGDDVDVCWRLREQGCTLGFAPAATVWHHRRDSIRAYVKQQVGYGRAEAQLSEKWARSGRRIGRWEGRIYGAGVPRSLGARAPRVYHGVWGHAPFQSIYERAPGGLLSLPLLPEFTLFVVALCGLSALGFLWRPLWLAVPLLVISLGMLASQALASARRGSFPAAAGSRLERWKRIASTGLLHLLQPPTRLWGRIRGEAAGTRPGSRRSGLALPWPGRSWIWSEEAQAPEKRVEAVEAALAAVLPVARGGDYDAWDLEVRGGALGSLRVCVAVEDHGGSQLIRFRRWPRVPRGLAVLLAWLVALAALTAWDGAWAASGIVTSLAGALGLGSLLACSRAAAAWRAAVPESTPS